MNYSSSAKKIFPPKPTTERGEYLDRIDTGGLRLADESVDAYGGFDPYGHTAVRTRTERKPRTDLRALSAQILAERERNRKTG